MKAAVRALGAASLLLLAGCSSQSNIWTQYLAVVKHGYASSTGSRTISLDQAAAIPYASLAYRVDGSSEQMLVLATDSSGDLMWTAASRVVLLIRDGRIVRSVGLPHDRSDLRSQAQAALPPVASALKAPYSATRQVDIPDMKLYGVTLICSTQQRGRHIVSVLKTAIPTTRVDERCESRSPRWSFTDSYWLDAETGFVWQSIQHLHPKGSTVRVKILRPPG